MTVKPAPHKPKSSFSLAYMLGVVAVVALAVVGVVLLVAPKPGVSGSGRTKGDPNAKIDFVEYSDFQ